MVSFDINETIQQGINDFVKDFMDEKLPQALQKACLVVEAKAKEKCPVGRTGLLRSSITTQVEGLEGAIGSNVAYAPFVELGTGIYAKNGDGRQTPWYFWDDLQEKFILTVGMQPQPFLEDAADESKDDIIKCFEGLV